MRDLQAEARRRGDEVSFAGASDPAQLTADQRVAAYDYFLDRRGLRAAGGAAALDEIEHPASAAALADTLIQHGHAGGADVAQNAINDVINGLPPIERERLGLEPVTVDRSFGRESLDAFKTLDRNGHGEALRDAIAEQRKTAIPATNEHARFNHFRFPGR